MSDATIRIDPAFTIGALNRRIFDTFGRSMWLSRVSFGPDGSATVTPPAG